MIHDCVATTLERHRLEDLRRTTERRFLHKQAAAPSSLSLLAVLWIDG
jgi:hypothetical protein